MNTVSCLTKIARHCRAFGRAEDGNVAILFGLSLIPLIGLIGGAIDYSRASAVRAAMQSAADATALAISKQAPGKTASQLQTDANTYFKGLFDQSDASGITVNAKFTKNPNQTVVVDASGNVASYFMRIWPFNINEIPVSVSSTTVWGNTRLRIALALDNTGSMSSKNKMKELKEGMYKFIDLLEGTSSKKGDVYVSVVPFSKDVNVGKSKKAASWIDWTDWDKENGKYKKEKVCKTKKNGKKKCKKQNVWKPDSHNTWNGCIADRDMDYDVKNTAPNPKNKATLFPADQYDQCPSEMIALTDLETSGTVADLKNAVKGMYPNGYTNITIGLAWAWQSLTETEPMNAPPQDPNHDYQRIIILLTDGDNTWNRFTTKTSAIDKRTEKVCQAIKDDGIILYTILVMQGNKTLLENCASTVEGDKKYKFVTSSDQIKQALQDIGIELTQLRVAM